MQVSSIMEPKVVTIKSSQNVLEACQIYKDRGVGCLVVMESGMVVGIVTERDIIERIILQELNPKQTLVKDIMSKNIKTIHATAPVEKAADIMKKNHIKKLPVILNNEIVGIITVTDIANILPNFSKEIIEEKEAFRFVNPATP